MVGHVSSTGDIFFAIDALLRDSWPASYKQECAIKRTADKRAPDSHMAVIYTWPSFWKRVALGAESYTLVLWIPTNQPETRTLISMMAHLMSDHILCWGGQPGSCRPIASFPEESRPCSPTNVTVPWIGKLQVVNLQLAFQMLGRA